MAITVHTREYNANTSTISQLFPPSNETPPSPQLEVLISIMLRVREPLNFPQAYCLR